MPGCSVAGRQSGCNRIRLTPHPYSLSPLRGEGRCCGRLFMFGCHRIVFVVNPSRSFVLIRVKIYVFSVIPTRFCHKNEGCNVAQKQIRKGKADFLTTNGHEGSLHELTRRDANLKAKPSFAPASSAGSDGIVTLNRMFHVRAKIKALMK